MKKGKGNPIPTKVRDALVGRAKEQCEVCGDRAARGHGWGLEAHHIVKRSQGGPHDLGNLALLCKTCHAQTDAPYVKGRLVFYPVCEHHESRDWQIEVRARKGSPLLATLAQGTIPLAPLNDGAKGSDGS